MKCASQRTIIWFILPLVGLLGCSQTSETLAVCSRAPDLKSSLYAVDSSISSMADISARQLQSMFAVLLGSLVSIGAVAPDSIADQFAQVEYSYHQISTALQNVYWEGTVGVSDAAVLASIDDLSRNENVDALAAVRNFMELSCKVELDSSINEAPGDEVNLPSPSVDVEPQPDLNTGFDNEESALRSYAYFIAERSGLSLTPQQALCVGTILTESVFIEGPMSNIQYDERVASTFVKCKVNIVVPATTIATTTITTTTITTTTITTTTITTTTG